MFQVLALQFAEKAASLVDWMPRLATMDTRTETTGDDKVRTGTTTAATLVALEADVVVTDAEVGTRWSWRPWQRWWRAVTWEDAVVVPWRAIGGDFLLWFPVFVFF